MCIYIYIFYKIYIRNINEYVSHCIQNNNIKFDESEQTSGFSGVFTRGGGDMEDSSPTITETK